MSENEEAKLAQVKTFIEGLSEQKDADIYLLSSGLFRGVANLLRDFVDEHKRRKNVILILATGGGDADAAYIIARALQRNYEKFTLNVYGYCKSAGTIIALGADEITMSSSAELGPLDVQLLKEDDLGGRNSGLDIFNAMDIISAQSHKCFVQNLIMIKENLGGAITTKTASEIATSLSVGLYAPISAQLDPMRIGQTQRAIRIAKEYGDRLGANSETVSKLIYSYPTHGFVIDRKEAKELFGKVVDADYCDDLLRQSVRFLIGSDVEVDLTKYPDKEGVFMPLRFEDEPQTDNEDKDESILPEEVEADDERTDNKLTNGKELSGSSANGKTSAKRGKPKS